MQQRPNRIDSSSKEDHAKPTELVSQEDAAESAEECPESVHGHHRALHSGIVGDLGIREVRADGVDARESLHPAGKV